MAAGLTLGAFDLAGDGAGYSTAFLGEGTSWGNPAPREAVIRSLLQDGSIVVTEGYDNREVVIRVEIQAADSAALAQGAADLFAELGKRNTLTYTPADGWGSPTVFDVLTSSLDPLPDDLAEVRGLHYFLVRLVCLPFGRSVTDVTLAPTPTSVGTARQRMYSFTVAGAARTEAAIAVQHASAALGDVLVYTFPESDYSPPLRQHASTATAAAATADAATVSGARNMIDSPAHFDVPGDETLPGTHVLIGRARTSDGGSVTIDVTAGAYIGSPSGGSALAEKSWSVSFSTAADVGTPTSYYMVLLTPEPFTLPMVSVGDPAFATTRFTVVDASSAGLDIDLDEVWLLNLTSGALTQVSCGSTSPAAGGSANRLFIEPPTLDHPQPRVLMGTEADMSDSYSPGSNARSWMRHVMDASDYKAMVVTTNTTSAVATFRHPVRWPTHAGS